MLKALFVVEMIKLLPDFLVGHVEKRPDKKTDSTTNIYYTYIAQYLKK